MSEGTQRRLAAIVAVDVAGYSRLMGEDEAGTLAALKAHREAIRPVVQEHGGRIVGTAGDGLLLEFPSVTEAVLCATEIQPMIAERNADVPDDRKMLYRIGINLGDVIIDGDDVYGDGVNIAARLEALAEPGGVCISQTVLEHVQYRVDTSFQDMGEVEVKNIARPVRIWHWTPGGAAEDSVDNSFAETSGSLPLPNKPSIAVLPFENMSGDPQQEFFADGVTEDIITALSRVRWLFVIARNSTFTYKGQPADVKRVSEELGVRYILEGSVRKAGNMVRITAQLIDATTGNHVWADRYDRSVEDVFAVQDEITQTIVSAIQPELGHVERIRLSRKALENMDAWECHHRGMEYIWHPEPAGLEKARECFEQALALSPEYTPALAGLAYRNYQCVAFGIGIEDAATREEVISEGIDFGRRAIAADDRDHFPYLALARVLTVKGDFDEAIDMSRQSLSLNPNEMHAHHALGVALMLAGRSAEALPELEMALRLSPMDPYRWATKLGMGICYYFLRDYVRSEEWVRKSIQDHAENLLSLSTLAAALAQQGRTDEAKRTYAEVLRIQPDHSLKTVDNSYQYRNPNDRKNLVEGLIKAGMPEE
jgi:adenylate cyclase